MRVNDFGIGLIGLLEKNGNYDMERIGKALDFATAAHDGQFRKSGEPYITHPIHVAKILASYERVTPTRSSPRCCTIPSRIRTSRSKT